MSKALFVMDDMPEKCDGCILHGTIIGKQACVAEFKRIKDENSKPDWCPLRELPEKIDYRSGMSISEMGKMRGWNACIDAITGGAKC